MPSPPIREKCDNKYQCKKKNDSKDVLYDNVKIIAKISGGLN